jgi:hypothetical protein
MSYALYIYQPYRYSATDRCASDAPITDSISDVTEYRKRMNSDIEYRKLKNAQNHSYSLTVSENSECRKKPKVFECIRNYRIRISRSFDVRLTSDFVQSIANLVMHRLVMHLNPNTEY